jgi:uncharacterized protein
MIAIISPAKTLDPSPRQTEYHTQPIFINEASRLTTSLKKFKDDALMQLMDISEKLAKQNVQRYKSFNKSHTADNSNPALLTFKGDVYLGLKADSFDDSDLNFAQDHIRILSGLYGILRPLDLMQEYRLEMGTELVTSRGKNLYEFWGDKITKALNNTIKTQSEDCVINLASQEYWKALQPKILKAKVIQVDFHEERDGKISFVSFNAKKARGMMCHFIIKNRLIDPESLKAFDYDGYYFSESLSGPNHFRFLK